MGHTTCMTHASYTYSNNYTFNYSSNGRKFHRDNIPSLSHDKKPLGIELFHRTLFPVAEMSPPKVSKNVDMR